LGRTVFSLDKKPVTLLVCFTAPGFVIHETISTNTLTRGKSTFCRLLLAILDFYHFSVGAGSAQTGLHAGTVDAARRYCVLPLFSMPE
jgi:hypothetical protein